MSTNGTQKRPQGQPIRTCAYCGKVTGNLYACSGCADLPALDKDRG
jgi:hypothetical protein